MFFKRHPVNRKVETFSGAVIGARIALGVLGVVTGTTARALRPDVAAVRVSPPPMIDGDLSDEIWKASPLAVDFTHQTGAPAETTRVWSAFDEKNLYFAFDCSDTRPGDIRAQQKKRNGGFDDDDWVSVGIDPLGDRKTMNWFTVNPLGTLEEEIPGGAAAKIEWRGDWTGAAKRNDHGWTAELAVPFALLKYPPGQKRFGVVLRRRLGRIGEESVWPSGVNYYTHENQATLTGVTAPKQIALPRYMPYLLLGAGGSLKNNAGIDIKYSAPNNITGLLALRPDFQTIEDVIQTVDFSYNPRFQQDRRPFFTDGSDHFNDDWAFYSRRVEKVDAGLKAFGKVGRVAFGAMDASRFGGNNALLANMSYDVTRLHDVGASLIQSSGDRDNRVVKLTSNWKKPVRINSFYWGGSVYESAELGKKSTAYSAYIDRYSGWGLLGWHVYYNRIPKSFDPALGFVYDQDRESVDGWIEYGREPKTKSILNWNAQLNYAFARRLDRTPFYEGVSPELNVVFPQNWRVTLGYDRNNRYPNHDRIANLQLRFNIRDLYRSSRIRLRQGKLDGGRYLFASLEQGFKFTEKLSSSFSLERLSLDYPGAKKDTRVTQGVYSGVYDITPERGFVFRLVANQGGTNGYAAYRQELRKGMDIFLVLGDPNTERFKQRIGLKIVNTY